MEYYKSNALYEHISKANLQEFKFVVGNSWQLVYGDSNCNPLLLVFIVGVPSSSIDNLPNQTELDAFTLLNATAQKSGLPIRYIRFASDIEEIESVRVSDATFKYETLSMPELSVLFSSFGLPVSKTHTLKYLNDKTSSAYHNWQRTSLGSALTVSDIDLWKIVNGSPISIFELKRSYYDLQRWKPFADDYRNFKLISNLCNAVGLKFKIIYNQRIKTPFEDKIDKLKIFSVDFSKSEPILDEGIINLNNLGNV